MNRIAAISFASVLATAAQADQSSAFQDAKAFATGKTQGVFTGVRSGTVEDKIPGYGTNPSETQFFQGGQGALSGPGVTKMQSCASYTPGQDKVANQECEAVNFLARNPDVRPQFNIGNNDQMVLGAKNSRNNAESFFQSTGINGGTGGGTQCTTRTETTPAQYSTETCTSLKETGTQQCTMGRTVNIDTDANFQCDQTVNAYENLTCEEGNLSCALTGVQLACVSRQVQCINNGGDGACCQIQISCSDTSSAVTINHWDCCGYAYTKTIADANQFINGVTYNPAGAKIHCTNTGSCAVDFENYYCRNPSTSIGHYPNTNTFNLTTAPTFSCTTGGGCEALDARAR